MSPPISAGITPAHVSIPFQLNEVPAFFMYSHPTTMLSVPNITR